MCFWGERLGKSLRQKISPNMPFRVRAANQNTGVNSGLVEKAIQGGHGVIFNS